MKERRLLSVVLTDDVADVLVVLVADVFNEFGIGLQRKMALQSEGPGVRARIVNRHFTFEVTEVGAAAPFDDVQFFGMGMGREIEPEFVVETDCIP